MKNTQVPRQGLVGSGHIRLRGRYAKAVPGNQGSQGKGWGSRSRGRSRRNGEEGVPNPGRHSA
eukprot:426475-Amorphochlora_amoeboformis.AAC.1